MTIFLTGTTGFLGGKLLTNLLQTTDHDLYILVRNVEKAKSLVKTLPNAADSRIHIIEGDITKPLCGLSDSDVQTLKNKIQIFYHLAALVKFDQELRDELFLINYEGTKNTLELAKLLAVEKYFYVSTAYTVGKHELGVEKLYPLDVPGNNPYEDSKIKSEHLVFSAASEFDVSIFRPSIIVGDSETGEANSEFTLYGFMRALDVFKRRVRRNKSNAHKIYHLVGSKDATSNVVPVNYVADILALAESSAKPNTIYNIINPNPIKNEESFEYVKKALDFENIAIIKDTKSTTLSAEEIKLNEMIQILYIYLSQSFNFEDLNTQKLIENSTIAHLNMSSETMELIINAYASVKK